MAERVLRLEFSGPIPKAHEASSVVIVGAICERCGPLPIGDDLVYRPEELRHETFCSECNADGIYSQVLFSAEPYRD